MGKKRRIVSSCGGRFQAPTEAIVAGVLKGCSIEELPILEWTPIDKEPLQLSLTLVCPHRQNVAKFFYEMVSRWLIPGKQVEVALHFSTNFTFSDADEHYTLSELILSFENEDQKMLAERNLSFLKREILMGVSSFYHATKILEMKGLNIDEKTSLIQENIARLVRRFPKTFDYDLFQEMQQFMVGAKQSFKAIREPTHISRILFTLYRFRKSLKQQISVEPSKRHVFVKCRKSLIHTPFGKKEVLSLYLGINFLKEHELFEERHLLSALSHLLPGVQSVPDSYFVQEGEDEELNTLYLEVEKENRRQFSMIEVVQIERGLEDEIQSRIEQLVPPIFMPRNEEEVMRNILALSQQLRYLKDLPQMVISFDEQTSSELAFTVILVRLVHSDTRSIQEQLARSSLGPNLSVDRVKVVGSLHRKYPKEATVIRVRLPSENFLRKDYSVDLFEARLYLAEQIQLVIGDVRDYNGGMIAKQNENFLQLKQELSSTALKHPLLLQNFFHAIFPVHLSTTLDPKLLKTLFSMFIDMCESGKEGVALESQTQESCLFVMTKFQDFSWKQKIFSRVEQLSLPSNELLSVQMQVFDSIYLGFIYLNPEVEKQQTFLEAIPESLSCFV